MEHVRVGVRRDLTLLQSDGIEITILTLLLSDIPWMIEDITLCPSQLSVPTR